MRQKLKGPYLFLINPAPGQPSSKFPRDIQYLSNIPGYHSASLGGVGVEDDCGLGAALNVLWKAFGEIFC